MKKVILILAASISLGGLVNAQNQQWMVYSVDNNIYALANDVNKIWIGKYSSGMVSLDINTGEKSYYTMSNSDLPADMINNLAFDDAGKLWIGTFGGGLASFDELNWVIYNDTNSGLPTNHITNLEIDEEGIIWLSALDPYLVEGTGLIKFDGTNWTIL